MTKPPTLTAVGGLLLQLLQSRHTQSLTSRMEALTWVIVVPFHDADVHGGGRLWHWWSLPLRRVAFDTAPLHGLKESKGIGEGHEPSSPSQPLQTSNLGHTARTGNTHKRERYHRQPLITTTQKQLHAMPGFRTSKSKSHAPRNMLYHFLHPVKLRRRPSSHVHMVVRNT